MKITLIFLFLFVGTQLSAAQKDETQVIAKGIQCTYLREQSFVNIYNTYSIDKGNPEYIKKVSDGIYSQAFKICDPENTTNADKEILTSCTTGCDQAATKGLLGMGGPSTADIEKCKKMCHNYSDHLSHHYTAALSALTKFAANVPVCPSKVDSAPIAAPSANPPAAVEKEKTP